MNLPQKAMLVAIVAIVCVGAVYTLTSDGGDEPSRFHDWDLMSPDDIPDMSYSEAESELSEIIEEFTREASDGNLSVQATSGYVNSMNETVNDAMFAYSEFRWMYDRDPTSLADEYVGWSNFIAQCSDTVDEALREVLGGPGGDALRRVIGDDRADSLLAGSSMTEEERSLRQTESEIVATYFSTDPSDTDALGTLYLELIDVRNQISELNGYGSYADYAYQSLYTRGYSPEDSDQFKEMVRELVVPLYDTLAGMDPHVSYVYADEAGLFDDAKEFIHGVCPEFGELYDAMVEGDLIDFEDLESKNNMGYTMVTMDGGDMFLYIYNKPYGNYNDMTTLVHEFGHAASYALSGHINQDYDVAEICSQGLEALYATGPGSLYGTQGDAVPALFLETMLLSMIEGCIEDEFQQRAYEGGLSDPGELDALYAEIEAEYGYESKFEWYEVTHNFDAPFYYISYAVSAFNALEIFVDSQADYDAAVDEYLDVIVSPLGYSDLVESLGMCDAFDREDMEFVLDGVSTWVGEHSEPVQMLSVEA